jgi:methylenetetrahydrofolate reductase (NADPH)
MHLTCTNMPRSKVDLALDFARTAGIQNILALRGDAPRGQKEWVSVDTGFSYARDLVAYIKEKYDGWFCVSVAGYVEGHPECPDKEMNFLHLKEKVCAIHDNLSLNFEG